MNHTATQSSRVVAVPGAGTGIGRATARAFAAEGAHVVAIRRRPGPREETAAGHDRVTPPAADITGGGEPERIVEDVLDTHGRLDVLVNNAGIVRGGALGTLTPEVTGAQPATNLITPVLLAQAALPPLVRSGGVIVNVSTSVGQRAWPVSSVYAASKTALELLTRSWAVELAPRGIRAAAVGPGTWITAQTAARDRLARGPATGAARWADASPPARTAGPALEARTRARPALEPTSQPGRRLRPSSTGTVEPERGHRPARPAPRLRQARAHKGTRVELSPAAARPPPRSRAERPGAPPPRG
ncbi:SDR family NAD(P)-dependent oxidoreductase [Streptomyces albidoflavus]